MPEGEEEEQEIENLFEQIMKKNFPIWQGNIYASTGSSESQSSWIQGETHQDTSSLHYPRLKDKERILKAAKEKETVTYKRVPIRLAADFSNLAGKSGLKRSIQSHERQGPISKMTLSSKAII